MDFGERVRTLREHLKLTEQKFGDRIGMSRSNVLMIENGDRQVSAQLVQNICDTFGVDPRYFFGGIEKPEDAINTVTKTNTQSIIDRLDRIERKVAPGDLHDPVVYRVSVRRPLRDVVSKIANLDDEVLEKVDVLIYGYLQGRAEAQREDRTA